MFFNHETFLNRGKFGNHLTHGFSVCRCLWIKSKSQLDEDLYKLVEAAKASYSMHSIYLVCLYEDILDIVEFIR